eukprot:gnl/TRDRNA2_/TRDRNA2_36139_c0_seq1.p1 gnl/TRDRNA2_/TRDRNA2_36139_c0~~gnl/TRDRNA2_/TRDRNA2_36139_c0_seq1.p1  ORF type:complete len:259 (+),score=42.30 gnl/TRDRNA2_/TRDRNA2_36139_c0_seq1:92-868(+)
MFAPAVGELPGISVSRRRRAPWDMKACGFDCACVDGCCVSTAMPIKKKVLVAKSVWLQGTDDDMLAPPVSAWRTSPRSELSDELAKSMLDERAKSMHNAQRRLEDLTCPNPLASAWRSHPSAVTIYEVAKEGWCDVSREEVLAELAQMAAAEEVVPFVCDNGEAQRKGLECCLGEKQFTGFSGNDANLIRETFANLDGDGVGYIDMQEFSYAMAQLGFQFVEAQLKEMMQGRPDISFAQFEDVVRSAVVHIHADGAKE